MALKINRLTDKTVQALKAAGLYADGNRLHLQVSAPGAKSWIFRYKRAGRARDMGLGSLADVSLAAARKLAASARDDLAGGRDPIEARAARRAQERAAAASGKTFKAAAVELIESHEAGWRNAKHRQQWRNTLETYAYPVLGSMAVGEIGVADVLRVLEPIWRTRPETASRVRGRIERVLAYAKAGGLRSGENPAQWRGHLDQLLPARSKVRRVRHQPALPYAEMPAFMADLRRLDSVSARALEFCILTATRTNETVGATWPEFDLDSAVWTIPAERMKAGDEHRVPLCERTVAIIEAMKKTSTSAYVFPGWRERSPLSDMALLECLRGLRKGFTVHGFRSSFRDWAGEETAHAHDICEAALAHTRKDKAHAAYQRGDLLAKRRQLMSEWAGWCEGRKQPAKAAQNRQRGERRAFSRHVGSGVRLLRFRRVLPVRKPAAV